MESQAVVVGVLPAAAEPALADEETGADSAAPAPDGNLAVECGVGRRFHERHALRRPTVSDIEYSR